MFTRDTLTFLRALKRNNDREWFRARKDRYDQHVRGPMVALVERLRGDFARFAPEFVADPKVCLYRPYRDTRFSDDKRPLKTQVSASFPTRALGKGEGAGLYLEVTPDWCWMGGGFWKPSGPALVAIREHLAGNYRRLDAIVRSPAFVKGAGPLHGEQLTRMPRGYPADHPAGDYLRYKQFLVGREFAPAFATDRRFYRELVKIFEQTAKLARFLNEPLIGRLKAQSGTIDEPPAAKKPVDPLHWLDDLEEA